LVKVQKEITNFLHIGKKKLTFFYIRIIEDEMGQKVKNILIIS